MLPGLVRKHRTAHACHTPDTPRCTRYESHYSRVSGLSKRAGGRLGGCRRVAIRRSLHDYCAVVSERYRSRRVHKRHAPPVFLFILNELKLRHQRPRGDRALDISNVVDRFREISARLLEKKPLIFRIFFQDCGVAPNATDD